MNTETVKSFGDELRSFLSLYSQNVVYAVLSMLIGMSIVIGQILPGVQIFNLRLPDDAWLGIMVGQIFPATGTPAALSPVQLVIGGIAVVFGIFWLVSTLRITKGMWEIYDTFEKKRTVLDPEDITTLMIRMMTRYRENKTTIRAMVVISIVGGICWLVLGASYILPPSQHTFILILGAAIFFILGANSLRISVSFKRYAKVWDARLDALARSEEELDRMLERG